MLDYFLGWYQGQLWSDLFGNLIFAIPVFLYTRYHTKLLHIKLNKLNHHVASLNGKLKRAEAKEK